MNKVTLLLLAITTFLYLVSNYHLRIFYILSNSMYPVIKKNSLIITTSSSDYREGDIISFSSAAPMDSIVTHRIVQKKNEYLFVTKGDHNSYVDINTVSHKNILGKVLITIPPVAIIFVYVIIVCLYSLLGYFLGKILYTIIQTFHAIINL